MPTVNSIIIASMEDCNLLQKYDIYQITFVYITNILLKSKLH